MQQTNKEQYIGSVRFFKHLIISIFLVIISVPSILCFYFAHSAYLKSRELDRLKEENQELNQELSMEMGENAGQEESHSITDGGPASAESDSSEAAGQIQADQPYYQELYPDLYVTYPERFIKGDQKTVYLTFDDGPSSTTDTVLDVLGEKQVKATFFIIGEQLHKEGNADRLKRIAQEGHTIGIHTYSHDYTKIYSSVEAFLSDFYEAWAAVKEITGTGPSIFRFPGGSINSYNGAIYQEIIAEMTRRGFVYFDWNVSAQDAVSNKVSALDILSNASSTHDYQRIILLMHDSEAKLNTAQSLPDIIDYYLSDGFILEPLQQDTKPIVFGYGN